jgi:2-polyprenyl-3-methyl-5-hydroxy-6-metoxy-1,4-benzoquinol methylase
MVASILTGKPARLIAIYDSQKIANEWQRLFLVDVGERFRRLGAIELWECQETGLKFYLPAAAAADGVVYSQLEKYKWYYMADKWEFREALAMLPQASSLLEVGVGHGHFLQAARQQGHNCYGVELNAHAARHVRELGFEVFENTLDNLSNLFPGRFDAICSFQVLEHVPNPLVFLEGMMNMLKPGGRLILSVPNAAVMRRIDPENKHLLNQPPHHMAHWDASVFMALEKILPVEAKAIRREPLSRHHINLVVNGYLRNALSFTGPRFCRLVVNRLTTLPIQMLLLAGLRRFVPGHTLLLELEYQPIK